MIRSALFVATAALLAACQQSSPAADDAEPKAPEAGTEAATGSDAAARMVEGNASLSVLQWAGRWTGVEGMFVQISSLGDGRYSLDMQSDLDTRGTYEGREDGGTIRFERDGEQLTLRRATGDETGLKWLAGKQDCLMVREGEGYCRD